MQFKNLGNTEVKVSGYCLGTMYFGTTVSKDVAFRVMDAFLDFGGNFIDTANNYSYWAGGTGDESELLIGEWIRKRKNRHRIVLASKIGARPEIGVFNQFRLEGLEKKTILKAVEDSLRRLNLECLDLCYIHADLIKYPLEERLEALQLLEQQGKIRFKGCSNIRSERYEASEQMNEQADYSAFQAVQQKYSYLLPNDIDPEHILKFVDQDLIAACERRNTSLLIYSVLLSGAYEKGYETLPKEYKSEGNKQRFEQMEFSAKEEGLTNSQWVLKWCAKQSAQIIPLMGASSVEQLEQNLGI